MLFSCPSPDRVSRFGDVRFPAARAETASRDGVCLKDVMRRQANKSPELAVEPVERSAALTSTHEARPGPGCTSSTRREKTDTRRPRAPMVTGIRCGDGGGPVGDVYRF